MSLLGVGEKLLFTANDGVHGYELWVTDGTPPGTVCFRTSSGARLIPARTNPFGSNVRHACDRRDARVLLRDRLCERQRALVAADVGRLLAAARADDPVLERTRAAADR